MDAMSIDQYISRELAHPRYDDPLRLSRYGRKIYSQCDEDGLIAEIFHRIGTTTKSFVEFGVGTGVECNTTWLLFQDWSGLWIEGDKHYCDLMRTSHAHWINDNKLSIINRLVNSENINEIIGQRFSKIDIDLLSVDIDYNDYWVWKAIDVISAARRGGGVQRVLGPARGHNRALRSGVPLGRHKLFWREPRRAGRARP
ncbi:MAG: hypothetical protein WDN45_12835 [Caulobacteraceae bacterium]